MPYEGHLAKHGKYNDARSCSVRLYPINNKGQNKSKSWRKVNTEVLSSLEQWVEDTSHGNGVISLSQEKLQNQHKRSVIHKNL